MSRAGLLVIGWSAIHIALAAWVGMSAALWLLSLSGGRSCCWVRQPGWGSRPVLCSVPIQVTSASSGAKPAASAGKFDIRDRLSPRRLTIVMWDQAFLLRHDQG